MNATNKLLVEILDRGFDKLSWHGPNLVSSFRGLSAKQAARSIRGRKSIWQQVLHAAYWKQRVLNKLTTTQVFPRRGSNWPELPAKVSERDWRADQELLRAIHRKLRQAVRTSPPAKLRGKLLRMVYGIAAHDAYHAGQIMLLRKLQGLRHRRAA